VSRELTPDYGGGEVEIARIELKSTTYDVISLRAAHAARVSSTVWPKNTRPNKGGRSRPRLGRSRCANWSDS